MKSKIIECFYLVTIFTCMLFMLVACKKGNTDKEETTTKGTKETRVTEENDVKKYKTDIVELSFDYDEKTIYGKAYIPENFEGKCEAVILSHGYNGTGNTMIDIALQLAQRGVFAYCFDFCGGSTNSRSSGETTEMSITTEMNDLKAVINMISSDERVDSSKIYLYGESQGGFVSALTAADEPDKIAGLFLLYPAFTIPDDWKNKTEDEMKEPFSFMGMTLSRTFYDGLPQYDVFDHVKNFIGPVSVYHGTADAIVNISYAYRLEESFSNVKLTIFEGAGHGFATKDRNAVIADVCSFFEE